MSIKENKDLVQRFLAADAIQMKANITGKDAYFAPEFTDHGPTGDRNLKEYAQFILPVYAAFPDLKYTIEDIIAEKDKVVARYHISGTHTGMALQRIAPSGKKFRIEGIFIFRIAERRIVEWWAAVDTLGMMQQLGALPSAPAKK
jgi:predicted ester cyclase